MLADDENVVLAQDRHLLAIISGQQHEPLTRARAEDAHHLGAAQGDAIRRMCSSKRSWFRTQDEADKAARDVSLKYKETFSSYPCRACGLFHLTTRPGG